MKRFSLHDFVAESNRIEGIDTVRDVEVRAHEHFLLADPVSIDSLAAFVDMVASASLRDELGMNVMVGDHRPVSGGPYVRCKLESILNGLPLSPYDTHREYETLHPFMDGNGRSGRVLWLHMMGGIEKVPLGFLHTWYYQSLGAGG